MADLTWDTDRNGDQIAFHGPLTLIVSPHYETVASRWYRREIVGWSWKFGPTPHPVIRSTTGPLLAVVDAGANRPGTHLPEEEAKAVCLAAARAFGQAIVDAGR